jgi:NifB/MoaA-like Fe-S oxidoreductase
VIGDACERLNSIRGLRVDVLPVVNRFFGPNITVTGLVVGQDIAEEVRTLRETRATESDVVLVPDVMLRRGGDVFLDDMRPEQLESIIGLPLMVTEATAQGMVDAVTDLAGGVSW